MDFKFHEKFDPDKKESYDWNRVEMEEAKDSVVGKRFVKYNDKHHLTMEDFLSKIDISIRIDPARIIIEDIYSEVAEFKLTNVKYKLQKKPKK